MFQVPVCFCPDCGAVLPPISITEAISCYGCKRDFNIVGMAESYFGVEIADREEKFYTKIEIEEAAYYSEPACPPSASHLKVSVREDSALKTKRRINFVYYILSLAPFKTILVFLGFSTTEQP